MAIATKAKSVQMFQCPTCYFEDRVLTFLFNYLGYKDVICDSCGESIRVIKSGVKYVEKEDTDGTED